MMCSLLGEYAAANICITKLVKIKGIVRPKLNLDQNIRLRTGKGSEEAIVTNRKQRQNVCPCISKRCAVILFLTRLQERPQHLCLDLHIPNKNR